jgi:hypothetical protein
MCGVFEVMHILNCMHMLPVLAVKVRVMHRYAHQYTGYPHSTKTIFALKTPQNRSSSEF